ncbi:NAD-dependent succinate-semialdehyde dehydrogenase [Actinoplanes sp. NBRC 14428]|nr:NAD-dependent succinate-semialdehyde dehydrogenase [Actinoplanes sp. NBRC 14428]
MTTITDAATAAVARLDKDLFIGGEWRPASGGGRFPVENPATGEILCEVADATPEDGAAALDSAAAAQPGWAAVPPRERGEILRRAYEALIRRTDEVALLITLEMGKSLPESRAEVAYGADYLRWFGEEAVRVAGEWKTGSTGDGRILTVRRPVGPALLITPWNAPLAMLTRKIGPAVAAGCTTVVKPAAQTPLTALLLARLLTEAGLPPGVLNLVPTTAAGAVTEPLIVDRRLRKLSFTGSTEVGRTLLRRAADNVLRTSMELGGNAPFIVCADADLDSAVDGAMVAKMRNLGEACIAANRFLVHDTVADEFTRRLAARMSALTVGPGTDGSATVGPLIDARQRDRVAGLVDDAVARGAQLVCGGRPGPGAGYFYPPTVLADVPAAARLTREEIFGPVAPITTFGSDEQALAMANDTEFGLVGYLFTRDLGRAVRMAEALETGMVGLNRGLVSDVAAPFGGIKQSGLGREGGATGIDEYLETQYVAVGL